MKSFGKTFLLIFLLAVVLAAGFLAVRFFSGPEDYWFCQDGQWVKHGQPGAPAPSIDCPGNERTEIIVNTPKPNQAISSPLTVEGRAKGSWYFEASFPFKLVDSAGKVLAQSYVQAQSDWMTVDFVPFIGELEYELAATTTGKLIFNNDNPSGLPQNEKSWELPVIIGPSRNTVVKAFFGNNNLDPQVSCNKAFSVDRTIPFTRAIARAALEQLLAGPTEAEKAQGFFTSINSGVKIQSLIIENGVTKVDFDEQLEKAVGGSCRVSAIRAQITETLKQFPTVKSVVISINGRTEDILQP